jgi:hypothetical protein
MQRKQVLGVLICAAKVGGRPRYLAQPYHFSAGVAKLVDAPDLGSGMVKHVQVRFLSPALTRV